ncbi:MAG: hypothetical protein LC624_02925 [Halobacteriales archaeon]|nr:hypothetical protein [Halobacteriales archaeon]
MQRDPSPAFIGGSLAVAVASMSTAALLIRLVGEAGPLAIAFYRLAFATLLLAPWALARHHAELRAMPRRDALLLAGIGVVLALHFATWVTSLRASASPSSARSCWCAATMR